jgi:predicted RNA-binding Zn ribbon-like protein
VSIEQLPNRFSRLAGHAVLDLMNTVDWRLDPERRSERLHDMVDVLDWCLLMDLVDADEHAALRAEASAHPRVAARERKAVVAWREVAYDAVVARSPSAARQVAQSYRDVLSRADLQPTDSPGEWAWQDVHLSLTTPRDRIVRATLDLVTRPDLRLLHQCEDEACGWVYLDTSPRHNRRWCSASDCGNRNRARRFYERRRTGQGL